MIVVQRACDAPDVPSDDQFLEWAQLAARVASDGIPGELVIRVVAPPESARLNRRYRGKHGPTNVLSFPCDLAQPPPGGEPVPLGDLVICAALVHEEAADQGKLPQAHWAHLILHGVLHLFGYTHHDARSRGVMEAVECRLLAQLGHPDPYREAV